MAKEQLLVFRPNLEPRGKPGVAFVTVCAAHQPANLTGGVFVELRFDDVEIDSQLAVEFRAQTMFDDFVSNPRKHRQDDCRCPRVPERQSQFQCTSFPPVLHAGLSSRSTNPTPRTV